MQRRSFLISSTTLAAGLTLSGFRFRKEAFLPVRFGIVTDPHYADRPPLNTRFYQQSLDKIRECVEVMNREKVDFLVEIGDLKDEGDPPDEMATLGFLATIEKALMDFRGPLYHVLGNHDMDSISKEQFLAGISNHGFPKAQSYYSFNRGSFHFVVLDANFSRTGAPYDHGNFDWKDAHVPEEQLAWLKRDLRDTPLPTVVFVHQQLDAPGFPDSHRVYCPDNADAVRKILEDSKKVLICFQGHYHPGSLHTLGGIHYYTLKGVIEGSGKAHNSYAIVEIGSDLEVRIKGYRTALSTDLTGHFS